MQVSEAMFPKLTLETVLIVINNFINFLFSVGSTALHSVASTAQHSIAQHNAW